jgi:hypothetical protein
MLVFSSRLLRFLHGKKSIKETKSTANCNDRRVREAKQKYLTNNVTSEPANLLWKRWAGA